MTDERNPWDQQEGEPNRWYQRFCAFRLLGPGRSIDEAYRSEKVTNSNGKKRSGSSWNKASQAWNWKGRALAWDQHLNNLAETEVEEIWRKLIMGPNEVLGRLSEQGRTNIGEFITTKQVPLVVGGVVVYDPKTGKPYMINSWDIDLDKVKQLGHLVKSISATRYGPKIEMWGENPALPTIGDHYGTFEKVEDHGSSTQRTITIPADLIAPKFLDPYRDIRDHKHTEYVFYGGRGSTKSSFESLGLIYLLVNNPTMHAIALRQVADTLRTSVYDQINWAINALDSYYPGLADDFKRTTSPLEITYLPTGQKIYFRGADDAGGKVKSIKPPFGYIGIALFEELDQFHGPEAVRRIEQSAIRGGDIAYIFKSFNPPPTAANWANKYIKVPKENQFLHFSSYLDVPPEWLGKAWLDEATYLKEINLKAYEHEYLGIPSSAGGLVFENVALRKITDEEIAQFDRVLHGLDWGFYPDPAHYGAQHYDAARRVLYIFKEYRAWKRSNENLYKDITRLGVTPDVTIIADSAEPKSVADFRAYSGEPVEVLDVSGQPMIKDGKPVVIFGPSCRSAEKGPESVTYSIKWLQGLTAIVIDNERAPYAAEEFIDYEYEQDPDGNFISEYPDRANHAIDETRYACNLIWKRRGQ